MKYYENIGKYIAYDVENGSCWAKITGVAKTNSMNGEVDNYIVEERKWCNGKEVGSVKGKSLLACSFIKKNNIVDLENLSEAEIDKLFIDMLGADCREAKSAIGLGLSVEALRNIILDGN